MRKDDAVRLRHMRDAARKALRMVQGRRRADLDEDEMLALSPCRLLEIVGEAASQVSTATRARVLTVPWRDVIGMRNILIHGYFDVNLDVVWRTVQDDLPKLLAAVEGELEKA